jgi:hypothetical protein
VCRCGHCKHLTPEYKKLGEAVASDAKLKNSVVVAKVRSETSSMRRLKEDGKAFCPLFWPDSNLTTVKC